MCGLFGHTRLDPKHVEHSRNALHTLTHRGPDQWGDWAEDNVYLGHRRLSILDLSEAGRQPMISDDGTIILTANGEIYNFQSLREQLAKDFTFKSQSDSEVLLHGYRAWGIDGLLERIDGMFAFCLYDRREGKIFLARDHVGIKPLYYGFTGEHFTWASELKAIEAFADPATLERDVAGLYDFLTYLYIPAPKSLYKNIHKLEPAHYVMFDVSSHQFRKQRYWTVNKEFSSQTEIQDAAARVRALIGESTQAQMVADVPVGFFLSGGMDSSVVVAEAAALTPQPHTFTIGFDDKGRDESPYATIVAELFDTDHTIRYCSKDDIDTNLTRMKHWYDEPFADFSSFPSYLVSALAREHVTVVLTGDGGDEVFGGYNWYNQMGHLQQKRSPVLCAMLPLINTAKRRLKRTHLFRPFRKAEYYAIADDLALYAKLMGGMTREDKRAYAHHYGIPGDYDDYWHFREYYDEQLPLRPRLQYMDFHTYLPGDILTKVDRITMSVSLESRVPLLAKSLLEYAFSLPEPTLYADDDLKGLMKRAYTDTLPESITARAKRGFSTPPSKLASLREGGNEPQETILQQLFDHPRI